MKNRKKAAKHLNHIKNFHSRKKRPLKTLPVACIGNPGKDLFNGLSDYEVEQIFAEAVHIFKTEGFDPEQSEQEMETLLQLNPEMREVSEILNGLLARKTKNERKDLEPVVRN